jgi:hypothetical protein
VPVERFTVPVSRAPGLDAVCVIKISKVYSFCPVYYAKTSGTFPDVIGAISHTISGVFLLAYHPFI